MIGSADGNNSMYVFGSAQVRYYANFRDEGDAGRETYTGGFENNMTRLGVKGSVWDKAFTYQVRGQFSQAGAATVRDSAGEPAGSVATDSGFSLETAFAKYSWDNGFSLSAGQFKTPLLRESMIDNEYQLAANRSIAEAVFGGGYTQGFQFGFDSEAFRVMGGFNDGASNEVLGVSTQNSAYNSPQEADYGLNARAEFKAMGGGWERFDDFTSWQSAEDMGLLIGAGIHYQDGGSTGGGLNGDGEEITTNDVRLLAYTIDAQVEGQGWNAFAAFTGAKVESGEDFDSTNFGAVIQAGIFVTSQIELFGRWDAIFWDGDVAFNADGEGADDSHFLTAGANYYLSPESHAAKLSLNAVYAFKPTSEPRDSDTDGVPIFLPLLDNGYGLLGQEDDGEFGLIAQLQVMF
jgi:hypothetical protein